MKESTTHILLQYEVERQLWALIFSLFMGFFGFAFILRRKFCGEENLSFFLGRVVGRRGVGWLGFMEGEE